VTDNRTGKLAIDGTVCVANAPAVPTDGMLESATSESAHVRVDHPIP
jgi:hypothetical protein